MHKKKIAFKLTAGFVVIVLISMLAIGLFFIQMFRQYTIESQEKTLFERAHSIAQVISENSSNNGQMRGFGGFMIFLDTITESKVWITDSAGQPAIMGGMGGMGMGHGLSSDPVPVEFADVMEEALANKESVSQSFSSIYNEDAITVGVPILNAGGNVIGSVLLHAPKTGITGTYNTAITFLTISIFVALILAIALGIFYSILFTRPLKSMNSAAIEMANGNYKVRTNVDSQDEFGQLSDSLDLLASKLDYTIDQLFQEKGKMVDIISSISEGLVAFDLNLQPLSVNFALSSIMNRPYPYSHTDLKKDLEILGITNALGRVMSEKVSDQSTVDWLDKKLKFTLSPIIDNQSNVTGSVALVRDISESSRLEQLRKDFVANVSHEFRTPLTVIKGSLEALVDGTVDTPESMAHFHNRMLSEVKSLERLVGDLLELSRLQSGKISINKERIHIPNLLLDTIRSLQTVADKKEIQINYIGPQSTPAVIGDYDRLRQLFVIFIDNAVKYSPSKTTISVNVVQMDMLEISIADQGYGISKEELPYVWDRFYKSDKSRTSTGTGLGLAIAKHLVELHNGDVSMQSEPDKGSIVTVKLPIPQNS